MQPLTPQDLPGKQEYAKTRPDLRRRLMALKERRRVAVGDHCTVHFENRETVRYQVLEMLHAEDSWQRPGAVEDELAAYNPLVPRAGELSATVMFEYTEPAERQDALARLVGIERHLWLRIGNAPPLPAEFDPGQLDPRKISAVQYVKWRLSSQHLDLLGLDGTVLRLVIDHPAYPAQAVCAEASRREILDDAL